MTFWSNNCKAIVVKTMNFGYFSSFQTLDKGLIENFGATGLTFSFFKASSSISKFNNGLLFRSLLLVIVFSFFFYKFIFNQLF